MGSFILVLIAGILMGYLVYTYVTHKISKKKKILILVNVLLYVIIYIIEGIQIESVLLAMMSSVLLALGLIDAFTFEIPLECNIIIGVLGICQIFLDRKNWLEYLIGAVTVSGIFLIVYLLTKGKGIGGGDIKLMAAAGLLLGWEKILLSLFIASIMGSVIHPALMKIKKKEKVLAFGPYLAAGIYISALLGEAMIHKYLSFFA